MQNSNMYKEIKKKYKSCCCYNTHSPAGSSFFRFCTVTSQTAPVAKTRVRRMRNSYSPFCSNAWGMWHCIHSIARNCSHTKVNNNNNNNKRQQQKTTTTTTPTKDNNNNNKTQRGNKFSIEFRIVAKVLNLGLCQF